MKTVGSNRRMRKTACPVVWERWRAQPRHPDPFPMTSLRLNRTFNRTLNYPQQVVRCSLRNRGFRGFDITSIPLHFIEPTGYTSIRQLFQRNAQRLSRFLQCSLAWTLGGLDLRVTGLGNPHALSHVGLSQH